MLSVSGPPTLRAVFIFFSLPDVSLNQLALVVRVIDCRLNSKPVSAPPVPPLYDALSTEIWFVIHDFGTLPPSTIVFLRITWKTTGIVTGVDAASWICASVSADGWRDSQPESLSTPVVRTSSRVMWPVDRPTAPGRARQSPLPPTTVALAIGAPSDMTSRTAHTDAAVRRVPRIDLL